MELLAPAKRGIEQVLLCTPLEPIRRIHRYALCAEFIATTFFIRQVRNMPPHGALYRSAIARMFRPVSYTHLTLPTKLEV